MVIDIIGCQGFMSKSDSARSGEYVCGYPRCKIVDDWSNVCVVSFTIDERGTFLDDGVVHCSLPTVHIRNDCFVGV